MKRAQRKNPPVLVVILGAVLALTLSVVAEINSPYLAIEGTQIKQAADGSYQLLVDISVGHAPKTGMLSAINAYLEYNTIYVEPSRYEDNSTFGRNDKDGNAIFQIDPSLSYDKEGVTESAFNLFAYPNISSTTLGPDAGVVSLHWDVKTIDREDEDVDTDMLGTLAFTTDKGQKNLYIKAQGKASVPIGRLSFRIQKDQLPNVIREFNGQLTGAQKETGKKDDDTYLIRIRNKDDSLIADPILTVLDYEEDPSSGKIKSVTPYQEVVKRSVNWDFDLDSLMNAESAEKDVTINAYQAFGDGTVLDLADALVRYSPIVRGTHTSGAVEDFPIFWGADEGCTIAKKDGVEVGVLQRTTDASGEYDGGYTFTGLDGNPVPDSWYTPTGGTYTVTQKFTYLSINGRTSEFDIRVNLTVTPVTVTGVTAEKLFDTYLDNENLPDTKAKLDLPTTARLTTDVTPGLVSLTMPIDGWQNSAGADVANDLTNLIKVGTTDTWTSATDRVGDYTLTAVADYDSSIPAAVAVAYDATVIHAVYPWLTVRESYTLTAKRTIVGVDTPLPTYELSYVSTDANSGLLTLNMTKKVNGADAEITADKFRLKLPGGTIVDQKAPIVDYGFDWAKKTEDGSYDLMLQGSADDGLWELVQSSINLGGWFQAEVTENGVASEFVAAYVPARVNRYKETKEFRFTGDAAGLYPFYRNQKTLPTYVTLPLGDAYQVPTTYDGTTGVEPGILHSFKVDSWPDGEGQNGAHWDGSAWAGADPIQVRFGIQPYADKHTYTGFGEVSNPGPKQNVTMYVQAKAGEHLPEPEGNITLTYEETGDSVRPEDVDQLLRVIFDTQQEGYKDRQTVTLTLTNYGEEAINGIYIDNTGTSGCEGDFIITQAPPQTLPAHASITFKVSYVWDLTAKDAVSFTHKAVETPLKIYSDQGLLKEFEAVFKVTRGPVWRLNLEVLPADGSYGTAQPVEGVTGTTLDRTPASYTYEESEPVWVLATPVDGYMIKEIYYYDDNNEKQKLKNADPSGLPDDSMEIVVNTVMPGHDLTIYVVFNEPLYSKLMLLDLQGWSAVNEDYMHIKEGLGNAGHQLPLRLHKTDVAETAGYDIVRDAEDYKFEASMGIPTTSPVYIGWDELQNADQVTQLEEDTYLVVIPANAAHSQVRLQLRDVAEDIEPSINISLDYGLTLDAYTYLTPAGSKAELRHISTIFNSPPQGERMTATITLTAENEMEGKVTRTYKLIFARRSEKAPTYPMTAGNSPFGMIEWDNSLDKKAAKEAFAANDRFTTGHTPVAAADLGKTYWTEAWGTGTNYDQIDEALFVFAGEKFEDFGPEEGKVTNTAGDVVANEKIQRSVTVTLLNDSGATQKAKFEGTATKTMDLGPANVPEVLASVWQDQEGNVYKVRPGVYKLEYTYTDLDGSSEVVFSRPLIVLARLGNVDLEETTTSADADMVEGRVAKPLGFEANGYPCGQLFALRVCDANNDRNINNIDANTIRGGVGDQFYLPVGYSGK